MKKLKNFYFNRAIEPKNTIHKLRKIFYNYGFFPIELSLNNFNNQFFSSAIMLYDQHPIKATFGKGVSEYLSIASGYAELAERMQNNILFSVKFGNMPALECRHNDVVLRDLSNILKDNKPLLEVLSKNRFDFINSFAGKIECAPFYSIIEKTDIELPLGLIQSLTGSNGMCAGNNKKEAITQGICEIFERYSLSYIFRNKLKVPTISKKELAKYSIFNEILKLEESGYKIIVKDCSLNGVLPVIAIIAFNAESSKCLIRFGSDPCFEIALQRCLTEMFQSPQNLEDTQMFDFNSAEHEFSGVNMNVDYTHFMYAHFSHDFIKSEGESMHEAIFIDKNTNEDEAFNYAVNLVEKQDKQLYIRDVSYLDFPSFFVYIPGLSELYDIDDLIVLKGVLQMANKILLSLNKCNEEEIFIFIDKVNKYLSTDYYKFKHNPDYSFISTMTNILLQDDSKVSEIKVFYLLSYLGFKIKRYNIAFNFINKHIEYVKKWGTDQNITYLNALQLFLNLRNNSVNVSSLITNIKDIYGNDIADHFSLNCDNPEKIYNDINLPICGNCETCNIKSECLYPQWKNMIRNLTKVFESKSISQTDLFSEKEIKVKQDV